VFTNQPLVESLNVIQANVVNDWSPEQISKRLAKLGILKVSHERIYQHIFAEVNTFTTCDKKQSYWASFNWAGLEMQSFYKQNSTKPYQPMYIKFKGHLLNEKVDGFALNYDGLIRISAVQEYSFEVPAKCQ